MRCVECKNTLVTKALPEGAKVFVIVQASGRVISRYHCSHKVGGTFSCGDAGTCNLPVGTLEGAHAQMLECDKLVIKLEAGSADVAYLLTANDKATLLAKYRTASVKNAATVARGSGA